VLVTGSAHQPHVAAAREVSIPVPQCLQPPIPSRRGAQGRGRLDKAGMTGAAEMSMSSRPHSHCQLIHGRLRAPGRLFI
jgi:hypothetical protein